MPDSSAQFYMSGHNYGGTQIGQQNVLNESMTRLQKITEWFSPVDFAQKQKDVYRHEYADSKESFFKLEEFTRWKRGDIQVLWCHGIPGCGKTVLTSMIYEHLRSTQPPTAKVGIACIYCDSQQQHTQTAQNLLASLWSPFYLNDADNPPDYIDNLYRLHMRRRTRPDIDQVRLVIQSTIDDLEEAYILIDGLDECSDTSRLETMESIMALLAKSNTEKAKVHVFVTSRLEQPILEGISVEIQATKEEIKSMVERRIKMPRSFRQSLRAQVEESPKLQTEILDKIVAKANGMFLIADLHLRSLGYITNVRDLSEVLDTLPEILDEYYESTWVRIFGQEQHLRDIAHRTISWLYLSRRQLKIDELRHALALRPGDECFCADGLIAIGNVLEACQGLAVVGEHDQVVRLMHSTVRDYFHKQRKRLFEDTPAYLTRICLTYLCFDVFERETCEFPSLKAVDLHAKPGENIASRRILSYRLQEYPFLDYAAENWGYHARGMPEESCCVEIIAFLCSEHRLENAHLVYPQVFHPSKRRHVDDKRVFAELSPVRVAVSFGLEHTACSLVGPLMEILPSNQNAIFHDTWLKALLEAVENGQLSVTKALLDAGVEPCTVEGNPLTILDRTFLYVGERPRTALDKSVFYRHNAISDLLVRRRIGGAITKTTVKYAVIAENRHILSQYLFATIKGRRKEHSDEADTILHLATTIGKLSIVEFSLEHGALLESEGDLGLTALGLAVAHGRSKIVKYLLEGGANVSAEAYDEVLGEKVGPKSILQVAATSQRIFRNRLDLVNEYMLEYSSADTLDSDTEHFQERLMNWFITEPKPLELLTNSEFLAAIREDSDHGKIIEALLGHGADVSVRGDDGETLLHSSVISKTRLEAFLQYLKRRPDVEIDVDTTDNDGRTPLHWAAAVCNTDVMEVLIQFGADVSATDNAGATTLHYAIGSARCIEIAIEHGCRVEMVADDLGTPLQFAKSLNDLEPGVIEALERSLGELTDMGDLLQRPTQASRDLPNAEPEKFKMWLGSKRTLHEVLCTASIRMYLEGSQQQSYVEELARMDAEAKKRTRTWNLVHES